MTQGQWQKDGNVRIGVDFGTGSTVIAVLDPPANPVTLAIPGISRTIGREMPVHAVPSLIRYADGVPFSFGDEVARSGEAGSATTARWIRKYVCERSPVRIPAGGDRSVRYDDAAADLLHAILAPAFRQYPGAEVVFTLPAGAPAEYAELLTGTARRAGAVSCSWIPEEEAAMAGYGYVPAINEPFLVVSMTMAGMDVSVMVPEPDAPGKLRETGKASGTTGCSAIDGWIVQDLLVKFRLLESDPRAVRLLPAIQYAARGLREHCCETGGETVCLNDEVSGRTFSATFTGSDLRRILTDNGAASALTGCIDRAAAAMRMRGGDPNRIRDALLIGEGCLLPFVQEAVRSHLPSCTIHAEHPVAAVACGAVLTSRPVPAQDRIAGSYALRYWDPVLQEHHYRFIVHSGTRFPSAGQVARIVISAAYDGQTHLGIPLYEIANGGPAGGIELVSDAAGGVRLAGPVQDAGSGGKAVYTNERSPTLLVANPPARKGEPRFECTFTLDAGRNLCLSARDLVNGTLVKLNAPVHRLT